MIICPFLVYKTQHGERCDGTGWQAGRHNTIKQTDQQTDRSTSLRFGSNKSNDAAPHKKYSEVIEAIE